MLGRYLFNRDFVAQEHASRRNAVLWDKESLL
jgi:hypothetical protein